MMEAYIDFGNTAFKILIPAEGEKKEDILVNVYYPNFDYWEIEKLFRELGIKQVYYITVAPKKTEKVLEELGGFSFYEVPRNALVPYIKTSCDISTTGIDRMVNIYFMSARNKYPCFSVDAGTALNIEILDDKGSFIGGVIMRNPAEVLRELLKKAEGLQQFREFFEVVHLDELPRFGTDTYTTIAAGLYYEIVPGFKELYSHLQTAYNTPPAVYITGGFASVFYRVLKNYVATEDSLIFQPHLTLYGLKEFVKGQWRD